jgi:hypothetical protein
MRAESVVLDLEDPVRAVERAGCHHPGIRVMWGSKPNTCTLKFTVQVTELPEQNHSFMFERAIHPVWYD